MKRKFARTTHPASPVKRRITRRKFIQDSTALASGLAVVGKLSPARPAAAEARESAFVSRWNASHDRVWLGPDYWANPLQDWRVRNGRIECLNAALDRNVHLLTRQLGDQRGNLRMSVRLGRVGGEPLNQGKGSVGFRIGILGPLREYRNSLIFGSGLDAGITTAGGMFIGPVESVNAGEFKFGVEAIDLHLSVEPRGDGYIVSLEAHDSATGLLLGRRTRENVPSNQLTGNIALVANFGRSRPGAGQARGRGKEANTVAGPGAGRFWFADWRVSGTKLKAHDDQAFGPILFNQYTLSGGILKMTAQMPPIGLKDSQTVRLQVQRNGAWTTLAEEKIHSAARTAAFRIEKWNDKADVPYRLAYSMVFAEGRAENYYGTGTVRRDPVEQPVLTVGDISCNFHAAFPNVLPVRNLARLNPDLLAFTGDQFYESSGGYGIVREPLATAILDYLRKWYMHGWTWRELTRDRPSISIPDDHDVYQGNLWGESGEARRTTQEAGGYDMPSEWVNVVHRTQTAHHPDPYDPTPCKRGTTNYYGPMTYGRVSFAILADRQYKSGPEGKVPPTGGRGDHVKGMDFDPESADVPGVELLGKRQEEFLREWAADWRGADMKAVISQTIFTAMATTHGGNREVLRADYDTNGWPQTPRNRALSEIRKAFAFHIAGDQHLPAVVHYGIEKHGDAGAAFAGPAVNVGYPRWWEPSEQVHNRKPGQDLTGDFIDHLGHPLTVLAVKNGAVNPRPGDVLKFLTEKASGLGVVRFDKARRKIIVECWPLLANPAEPNTQFPGWPVTIDMLDNYGRKAVAHLPTLLVSGIDNPVIQVISEANSEIVYTLRPGRRLIQPKAFALGKYTIRISDPDAGRMKELKGLEALPGNKAKLDVEV
ncbi:MAG: alkaline phosphatase D family protein [Verrucomicrobia bacterium]|nr:alkaline phosphatase D family protein [Verrucomicrobiota bacterium]